jgi:putative spermidine/putrescine transport system substrate-binding protein
MRESSTEEFIDELRGILEETKGMDRRAFIKRLAATTAGATLLSALPEGTSHAQASDTVTMFVFGGIWKPAAEKSFGEPFTKKTGIKVQYQDPYQFVRLMAMHQANAQQIDVAPLTGHEIVIADRMKMIAPIDWSVVDKAALGEQKMFHPNVIPGTTLSMVFCYNKKKWPGPDHPKSWADFWNVEKFPGRRVLRRDAEWTIEAALVADGVKEGDFYPLDLNRAFRSLDKIKPHIRTWWSQHAQSQQLMEQEEVDLIAMMNGRASDAISNKAPYEIVWNGAISEGPSQGWCCPTGAPNPKAAMKLLDVVGRAEPQAAFARLMKYSPLNPDAFKYIEERLAKELPTYPENYKVAHHRSPLWWADNLAATRRRMEQWLVS